MARSLCRCLQSACIALVVLIFQAPWAAQAHDGSPRIELSAERINPGAPLEVRGINIAPEQPVAVALVGGGAEYSLGQVLGDPHGDFTLAIEVPREATSGDYTVRAFGTNRVVVAAQLVIAGAPVAREGEGEQRDASEPLLAPMPESRPAPALPAATSALPTASAAPQLDSMLPLVLVAVVAAIAATGLVVVIRRRPTSSSETMR
jgi:hypothetical protein